MSLRLYIAAGIIAAVVASFGLGVWFGRSWGRVDQLQDSVQAYETREGIDNDTNGLARYLVCRRLGGLPEQCDELRRLDEAAADQ